MEPLGKGRFSSSRNWFPRFTILKRIAGATGCSTKWYFEWLEGHPEAVKRFQQRRREGDLQSLRRDCVKVPDDYLAYLELGRFRNALVLDEYRRSGSEALRRFIETRSEERRVGKECRL